MWTNSTGSFHEILEIGPLEWPLLEMAKEHDFTAFDKLSFKEDVKPVRPFPEKYMDGKTATRMKMMKTLPSGGVGFLTRQNIGVLCYYLDLNGKMIPDKGNVFFDKGDKMLMGINFFSSSYKHLTTVQGRDVAYILDLADMRICEFGRVTQSIDGRVEENEAQV